MAILDKKETGKPDNDKTQTSSPINFITKRVHTTKWRVKGGENKRFPPNLAPPNNFKGKSPGTEAGFSRRGCACKN